jgi:DNA processing protein
MTATLPDEAYAAALAGLPGMTPVRLRVLLRLPPATAWAVATGQRPSPDPVVADMIRRAGDAVRSWRLLAGAAPPERVWARCLAAGVTVYRYGCNGYPTALADDLAPPAVLFARGDPEALDGRRVAVVGTRNATATGREVAAELGRGLTAAGVGVVSGLARGVDGWAHRGALAADGSRPVGVVACGLDVVYPSEHRDLWDAVACRGVLLSEVPPGTAPQPFRFPARNRILAGLADAVVVVESRARGGSLVTASEAERRGVPVLAVPGSPRNPAAEGTNQLIRDGATMVLDVDDVLVALGFGRGGVLPLDDARPPPDHDDQSLLDLFGAEPLDLARVVACSRGAPEDVALSLGRLEATGWLVRAGAWYERAPAVGRWR